MGKLIYKFADWLYEKLYDEPTYRELEDKVFALESENDELKEDVKYWREAYFNKRVF
jgi:hypothetical protein